MSMWSWLYPDRTDTVTPLIDVDERGTGPSPCCAHHEQRIREIDEARAAYFGQACDLADRLAEAEACIAELTAALDRDRPAPDRDALAADLERSWRATALGIGDRHAAAWLAAADTAIDTCRGLREAGGRPAGKDGGERARAGLGARPMREVDSPPSPPDPADTAKVGDDLGMAWLDAQGDPCCARHEGLLCTRADGHSGQHVATGAGDVFAVWPAAAPATAGGESPGSGATSPDPAPGGPPRHFLRRLIEEAMDNAARNPDTWPWMLDFVEAKFTDALTAWWPVTPARPDQRPVVAAILTAHELLADGTCRCRWVGSEIWHAEHVAAQIVGTGAVTR